MIDLKRERAVEKEAGDTILVQVRGPAGST